MTQFIVKYLITSAMIIFISEIAKKLDRVGALIASLPLITISVMIWMYIERVPKEKIASHATYTFWYVLPTLPMFLLMPWLLSRDVNFWISLGLCAGVTFICFLLTCPIARYFNINLMA